MTKTAKGNHHNLQYLNVNNNALAESHVQKSESYLIEGIDILH